MFATVLLVLSLVVPYPLEAARDEDQADKEEIKIPIRRDEITVNARREPVATSSQTLFGRDRIEEAHVWDPTSLIRSAPGVTVLSNGPRGGLSAVQIRGADPNFTLVLLDGLPLNDATDQLGGVYNLQGLFAGHLEQIEVVRGPLSTFFGSRALGGILSLESRRGRNDEPVLELELGGGNAGAFRTSASYSGKRATGDFFVGAAWEQESGRVADDRFEALHLLVNYGRSLGRSADLRVIGRLASWEADDYPDASGGPLFGSGEVRSSDNGEYSLSAQLQLSPRPLRHNLTFSFFRHDLERDSPGVAPLVPPSQEATRLDRLRMAWTGGLSLSDSLQLLLGADLEREDADNDSRLLLPFGPLAGDYQIERSAAGGFAELVGKRGGWAFEAGIRLDAPPGRTLEPSPRWAASYRTQGERWLFYGSWGRAFKLPSFFALASPRELGGNPELRPETVWGGDAGFDHHPHPRLTWGLTYFYNRYRELVDFDFDRFLHVNRSRVRTRGVESHAFWSPLDSLALRSSLTWQEVRDLEERAELLHRPRWVGDLSLRWTPGPRLVLTAEGHVVDTSLDRQIPVPQLVRLAGYGLVNLAATWKFSPIWSLGFRADNLTARSYQTLIGFPAPGRAIYASLRLRIQ